MKKEFEYVLCYVQFFIMVYLMLGSMFGFSYLLHFITDLSWNSHPSKELYKVNLFKAVSIR